jgi:hypothetical protein
MEVAVKALLACWLTAIAVLVWMAALSPPTFHDRFEPAVQHPLHSMARQGYCYPRMCRVG